MFGGPQKATQPETFWIFKQFFYISIYARTYDLNIFLIRNLLTSCWSWFCCHCPPRCLLLRRRPWYWWPWWGLRRRWWWLGGYGLLSLAGDRGGSPLFRSQRLNVGRRLTWGPLLEAAWGCCWSWLPEEGGGLYWCMRSNMSWALLTTDNLEEINSSNYGMILNWMGV